AAELLVADYARAIEHERFWHARGTDRELHGTDIILANPDEGVAVNSQKPRYILRAVPNCDRYDVRAGRLQPGQIRRFRGAWHAPTCEHVEQLRLPVGEMHARQAWTVRNCGRKIECRYRFADHRAVNELVFG